MKSRQFLRALLPWLMLVTLGCILLVFYMLSSSLSDEENRLVDQDMRQILALDTRINLEVMRLRHRQLQDYDSLSDSVGQVTGLLGGLQNKFAELGLPDALKPTVLVWETKESLLEDFKRQNTVLANSLYHFVNLSRQLHTGEAKDAGLLNAVVRDVLMFVNEQQTEDIPVLLTSLESLETASRSWGEPMSARGALLAAHGRQIVNNHIPVLRLMRNLARTTFIQNIEQAYGEYVRAHDRMGARAEIYRRLMAIFSLIMVISVVLIVLRLQYTVRELKRNISTWHQAETRLRVAASVFENLSEAMTVTGPDGRIQSVNKAFTAITGYSEAEIQGKRPDDILSSGLHGPEFFHAMLAALNKEGRWQGEIINRRKNGETYPGWLSITAVCNQDGIVEQFIAIFSDLSERKKAEANLQYLAYHDPLTGLANRLLFNDRLNTAMLQAHRNQQWLAVMLLDLDHFKSINDSLDHNAGDRLLTIVSWRLSGLLRESDTLARFGGDEFALLLPELTSHADAAMLAKRMVLSFEKPFELEGREVFTSTSIGIAVYPADGENAEILLKNADVALYSAKDAGRAAFRFFKENDNSDSLERLELETDLRRSVQHDELRLYYQPQVNAYTGMIYGVEALVRWQHPSRGLLTPDRFIGLAESTGYIEVLGRWCLETACRQMVEWQKAGLPIQRVAVNVSSRQIRKPDFMEMVLGIVEETGINPGCLEIELTESSMADDPEYTFSLFYKLREKGIRIAIDDFGTGYSSLSYLARYPVDVVKIDKSFIDGIIGVEQSALTLVQAIVLMSHTLNMETVAEGVETAEQRQKLIEMQCDLLQGYFYSRPCPAAALIELPCVT
ncbi:hypothetical protein AGMMS50256_24120 [Betaproteobacteria bacterium]|nr:hypothetical protein AGMMS50256_24120 [Betaproteobacteria bacterium]